MKEIIRIELFETFEKVSYYTFVFEQEEDKDEISETEDFFGRFETVEEVNEDLNDLTSWITEIGENRGAKEKLFRPENNAHALPPPKNVTHKDAGSLRLYCIRISDEIVILANGDQKTTDKAQDCPNVRAKFRFVTSMAKQIDELIASKELIPQGKELSGYNEVVLEY